TAMYPFHDALYRLDWGFRQHAVAEIEDVPGAACGALEHVAHPLLELGERREQRHWIEVPLDRPSGADPLPGGVERHTPVHTDYVAPGAGEVREKRGGVGAEVDHPDAGRARERPRRQSHRLHDVREIGDRVHPRQLEDLGRLTNRTGDLRSFAYREAEAETEGLERQQEVGEENRGIHAQPLDGLQGHPRGEL